MLVIVQLTTDSNLAFSHGLTVAHTVALLRISVVSDRSFFSLICFIFYLLFIDTHGIVMQL